MDSREVQQRVLPQIRFLLNNWGVRSFWHAGYARKYQAFFIIEKLLRIDNSEPDGEFVGSIIV